MIIQTKNPTNVGLDGYFFIPLECLSDIISFLSGRWEKPIEININGMIRLFFIFILSKSKNYSRMRVSLFIRHYPAFLTPYPSTFYLKLKSQ